MAGGPKIDDAASGKPSAKTVPSARPAEELSARNFIRAGLAFDLIVAAVILVAVALGRITADTIPVGLAIFVLVSIAIWAGIGLVAVPVLIAQRIRRAWTRRRAKQRAGLPATWDDWIDGPRPG
jgi:hypothetical protein